MPASLAPVLAETFDRNSQPVAAEVPTDRWRILSDRVILLRHKGTVYGRLDRDQFVPSESLLRLDAGQEPARSLWVAGQFCAQFFARHGYTVLQAPGQRHYSPPAT